MTREYDPLNPDPESGVRPSEIYKTSQDAYRNDVLGIQEPALRFAPAAAQEEPVQRSGFGITPQPQQPAQGRKATLGDVLGVPSAPQFRQVKNQPYAAGTVGDLLGLNQEMVAPQAPEVERSNFSRGFEVAGKQLKQTAYGTIALIGDTIGIDGVKEYGLKGYKNAEDEIQKISKASDSFTDAWDNGEIGKWVTYSLGYLGGQVLEAGVAAVGGAVVGSLVAPGAGTIGGAVAGAVEKSAAQAGVKSLVAKMIDAEASKLMSNQIAKELATEMATKAVYRKMGQTAALSLLNGSQELGSIYGEAVEQADKTGEQLSLGKVWLSGILATAVDSWADSKAISRFTDAFKAKGGVGGFAIEAFKGGVREGLTEGVQTGIERWGASKELSSPEAIKDYVDSMAVGVLGGSISGGASGLVGKATKEKDAGSTDAGTGGTSSKPLDPKLDGRMPGSDESADANQSSSQIDLTPINMSSGELVDTAKKDPAYMAAIYQMGTPDQQKAIESIVATAGTKDAFDAAFKSPETIAAGKAKIQDQSQADLVLNSVQDFIDRKTGTTKVDVPADVAARDAAADAALNAGTTTTKPPVNLSAGSTATTTVAKTTAAGTTTTSTSASKSPVSATSTKAEKDAYFASIATKLNSSIPKATVVAKTTAAGTKTTSTSTTKSPVSATSTKAEKDAYFASIATKLNSTVPKAPVSPVDTKTVDAKDLPQPVNDKAAYAASRSESSQAKVGQNFGVEGVYNHDTQFVIPSAMLAPFAANLQKNHGQSIGQLANRGGLSPVEVLAAMQGKTPDQVSAEFKAKGATYKELDRQSALEVQRLAAEFKAEQKGSAGVNNSSTPSSPDKLFSKDAKGDVKAVFFKKLKTVFYGKNFDSMTPRQKRALEMHEVGAHYAAEKMLGTVAYKNLLSDLKKLRGSDKFVDKAYDSIPEGTPASDIDDEALGYLVENYENLGIVQRLFQMVRDWYQKLTGKSDLTSTDIRNLIRSAYAAHQHEVTRVTLKENISAKPKPGFVKVNFQSALNANSEASKIVGLMSTFGSKISLSGSLSLSAQTNVYRSADEQIHDLDFRVRDKKDLDSILLAIRAEYPNSGVIREFSSMGDVISISTDIAKRNALTIDLFSDSNGYLEKSIPHVYIDARGRQRKINLVPKELTFDAKLGMGRAKDINDAIWSGDDFDTLFSQDPGKKTVSQLPSAIHKVMESLVGQGFTSFADASSEVMKRMRQSPNWSHLAGNVTPNMLRTAYNKLNHSGKDDEKTVGSLTSDQVQKLIYAGKGTQVMRSAAKPDRTPVKMIGGKVKDKTSNSGVYAQDDQVFLHPDANSAKLSDADLAEVDRAVAAGAKFTVKDTDQNAGEKQLAAHLKKKGVTVEDLTPKKESKTKKLPDAKAEPVTKDDTQAVLDSHERSLSPDDRREFQEQSEKMSADEQAAYAQQVRDLDAAEAKAAAADNKTSTFIQDRDRPARIAYPRDEVIKSSVMEYAEVGKVEKETRPSEIVREANKALTKEREKNPLIQWLRGVTNKRLEWAKADVEAAEILFGKKQAGIPTQYDSLLAKVDDLENDRSALTRKLGTMSEIEFKAFLDRTDRNRKAFSEIRQKIRVMPAKESGSASKSVPLPPVVARFVSDVRQVLMGMYQSNHYQQTIDELHYQLGSIQRALSGFDENGQKIKDTEARDAAFEKAYKRAEKYFGTSIDDTVIRDDTGRWNESGIDGVSPVDMKERARMYAYLAQGNSDLQQMQDQGLFDVVALFRRNISESVIRLTELNQKAIAYGQNLDQIKEIYNAAQESLRVIQALDIEEKRKGNKATEATDIAEAIEEAVMDAEAARKAYANNLIAALKPSKGRSDVVSRSELTAGQVYQMAVQMVREGVVTQEDILEAYGANGLDRPANVIATFSKLAVNTPLLTHLATVKNRTVGRFEWFKSMDMALAADPTLLSRNVFTEAEIAAHKKWSQRRRSINGRRNNFGKYGEFDKGGLFGQLIFNRFSLNQVTNQKLLSDQDRIELQSLSTNARETWFEDVRYAAFYGYGKFRNVLLNPATSPLSQSEIDAYLKFEAQRNAAIQKGTESLIRSKYFEELRNLDGLARGGDVSNNRLTGTPGLAQTAYERFYVQMVNAQISELDQIMANAIEYHNAATANTPLGKGSVYVSPVPELRYGTPEYEAYQNERLDIDAQNKILEELTQETINSIDAHNYMVAPNARNRTARYVDKFNNRGGGFGETVLDAADRNLGKLVDPDQQSFSEDASMSDRLIEGDETIDSFEASDNFLDSYSKAEGEMFGDNELGSDDDPVMSAVAKSPHSPVLTVGFLQGFVQRIVSTWKGAPNVVVLADMNQLPEPLRTQMREKLGAGYVGRGLYVNGTTYLFSSGLNSEQEAEFVLFHEAYGHYGMRALLGDKLDSFLETAYRTNTKIRAMADQMMQERDMGRLEAVEEVLADMAGENKPLSIVKQWLGKVIAGLRNAGFNSVADWLASKTDAEVSSILNAARNQVLLGNQQSLESNLYELRLSTTERLPWEMFATKGGKTTAYARYNAGLDQWTAFIANNDDLRGASIVDYTVVRYNTLEEAYDALKFKGKVERRQRSGLYEYNKKPERLVDIPQIKQADSVLSMGSLFTKEGRAEWRRKLITVMQNEYKPVFDVVDHLRQMGRINENIDVKEALLLYERRTGNAVKFLRQKYVQPIMKLVEEVKKQGGTEKDINDYLVARFADERNRAVANINDEMQDGGSGMTRATAERVLAETATKPFYATLQEITRFTDQMGNEKVWYMFNHGMITRDARDKLLKYTKYVNLSGVVDDAGNVIDDPGAIAGGSKFNVKGTIKRAFGRGDGNVPQNVLARTIVAFEAEIIRSQKNMIAQRVLGLMEANYDPNFVVINKLPFVQKMNYETGKVEMVPDENYIRRADVMVAKVRGIPVTIEFKDNRRGSFADAIHGLVAPKDSNAFMEMIGKFNQTIGQMLTTYNPAWAAVNFVRDSQTMFFNAAANGKLSTAQAAEMAKNLVPALRMAMFAVSNGKLGNPPPEWVAAYREMTANGGLTSFVNREGLEEQQKKIDEALAGKRSFDKTRSVLEWIENLSTPFEIAPRLAAYKVAKDAGWSPSQAAVLSGEITVNFNMRGSSKSMRQLYLFLNPAIQGTAIMYDLMKKNPKRFAAIAGGMFAFGFATSLMGRAAGGQDDEGRDLIDKIPTFKRATSIVLWAGGPSIPIPYGWNAFFAAGTFSADMALGKQTVGETSKRIVKTALEAFSPMGTAGIDSKDLSTMIAKAIVPTAGLPLVEWIANENRFGSPIRKEQSPFESAKSPDSQMYFKSTSPISRFITETLNDMTTFGQAGNKFKSGVIDLNPAGIDFAISAFLPGLVNEAYKGASLGVRAATGETIKNTPLPLLDRFTAKIPDSYDAGAFRRASEMIETAYKEFKNVPSARQQILGDFPQLAGAHAQVTSAVQQIRKLNSDNDKFQNNENISSDLKVQRANQTKERVEAVQRRVVKNLMDRSPKIYEAMQAND